MTKVIAIIDCKDEHVYVIVDIIKDVQRRKYGVINKMLKLENI